MGMKELRKEIGFSQIGFSEYFGIPLATVKKWDSEAANRRPAEWAERLIIEKLLSIKERMDMQDKSPWGLSQDSRNTAVLVSGTLAERTGAE